MAARRFFYPMSGKTLKLLRRTHSFRRLWPGSLGGILGKSHALEPEVPKAPMAKPESSFAAMLLQRSRAAAATRAEVQKLGTVVLGRLRRVLALRFCQKTPMQSQGERRRRNCQHPCHSFARGCPSSERQGQSPRLHSAGLRVAHSREL